MSTPTQSLAAELNACGQFYYAGSHCTKARVRDGRLQVWDDLNEGWLRVTDAGALRKPDGRGFKSRLKAHNPNAELLKALIETADQLEDMIEAFEGLAGLDSFHRDTLANSRVVLRAVARKTIAKATEGAK